MSRILGALLFLLSLQPAYADLTKLFSDNGSDLENLPLLKRVTYLVKENYVEPQRIQPGEMFQSALKRLEEQIPEVRLLSPTGNSLILVVNRERLELSKEMINIYSLTPSLSKALLFIKKNLVSTVKDEALEYIAIQGILSTLDPHSTFLTKEMWEQTQIETIKGSFGGVGIVISSRNGKLTIIAPLDGTPASRAGLKAGDIITRINDESTINMDTNEAANLMRGVKGTEVAITVMREGFTVPKEYKLKRDTIKTQSVEYQPLPDGIAFIRVKNFQANTTEDVRRYLKQASDAGPIRGLILDLRNDPGGLLGQAVDLADLFVDDGTIVSTVNRANREQRREKASSAGGANDFPLTVLVNGSSASASEIVAGAIKYLDRGLIIGRRTFGKSSVQQLFELPKDAALKLTTEKYLTSNGTSLQSVGVIPDIQLTPARVDDELVALYSGNLHLGEEDLEGHLKATESIPVDPSAYTLRYLGKKSAEENEYQPIKAPLEDFEISLAWTLLKRSSQTISRKKQLKELQAVIEEQGLNQRRVIAEALTKKGVAWSTHSAAAKKRQKGCAMPTAQIDITPGTDQVVAGTEMKLQVSLQNPSNCNYLNLWAMTQAEDPFLQRRELLFGNLAAHSTRQAEIKIKVPEYIPDRLVSFKLAFYEDEESLPLEQFKIFRVVGLKPPRFSYVYRLEDAQALDGSAHKPDGKLNQGELVKFHLKVTNLGEGVTKENVAVLKNLSGPGIFLKKGRSELGLLKAQQTANVVFEFEIRPYYTKSDIQFELQVYDTQFAEFLSNKVELPLGKPLTPAKPYVPPQITLNTVDSDKVATSNFITLKGKILDDQGIKDMFILVNKEKEFYQAYAVANKGEQKEAEFTATLPLQKGVNNITITARDNDDFVDQNRVVILYKPQEAKLDKLTLK